MPFTQLHDRSHRSILIIEDTPEIREALRLILEMEGYVVYTATNGQEALDMLRILNHAHKPCLILLDLMMPIMNGYEFMEAIQEDVTLVGIPVAMMTASEGPIKHSRVIKKPFSIDVIIRLAHDACMKRISFEGMVNSAPVTRSNR